jgi:hypothetical protein
MLHGHGTRFQWVIRLAIAVLSLLCLTACATPGTVKGSPDTVAVPDKTRLRARLAEFHTALGANDIARWYDMSAPVIREKMSLEQFKKDMRWDENAARRKQSAMKADLGRICNCVPMQYLRCVLIVDVSVGEKKEHPLETWEYADGEWYVGYVGPESRGLCPGER